MAIRKLVLFWFLLCVSPLFTQELPSYPLPEGTWDFSVWSGVGIGIYSATESTRLWSSGFRAGRVITGLHGKGLLRGNLEYGVDIVPLYLFRLHQHQTIYGGGINPVVLVWNVNPGTRFTPFVEAALGGILTTRDVPRGGSDFNFSAQDGFGLRFFPGPDTTLETSAKYLHISNAHLGRYNPGFNQIYLTVSYHWLMH